MKILNVFRTLFQMTNQKLDIQQYYFYKGATTQIACFEEIGYML